jgi:hypothetical protein
MLKLMLALAVVAALGGAVALAPLRGRTLLDRWKAARSPTEFVERGREELKASFEAEASRPHAAHAARAAARHAKPPRAARHAEERPTEKDRAELDRIVAEHASRP